jgi:hypothetical protein
MGKRLRKMILKFIEDIPDSKLEGGFPSIKKTIWQDDNCRLDMQTLTTKAPRCWNLQVQMNKQMLLTSAKKVGDQGASVAKILVPIDAPYSVAVIREKLKECAIEFGDRTEQF